MTGVEVRTVDGYQGREKETIILRLVRSNSRPELGFLSESQEMFYYPRGQSDSQD